MANSWIMTISSVQKVVNISSCKKVVFPIVIILIVIQSLQYIYSGGNTCGRLLDGGVLVDQNVWQPAGCMLHKYSERDAEKCFKTNSVTFVGDSRIRDLYYAFVQKISPSFVNQGKMHSDINFRQSGMEVNFVWMPELNSSALDLYKKWMKEDVSPRLIVQSTATHTIKRTNGSIDGLTNYHRNFTRLLPSMVDLTKLKKTKILWMLQEPVEERKLREARKAITSELIEQYNQVAVSLLEVGTGSQRFGNIYLLKSNVEVASQTTDFTTDGLHLVPAVVAIDVSLLMNFMCNQINQPIDGSCCQMPPPVSTLQLLALALGVVCTVLAVFSQFQARDKTEPPVDPESAQVKSPNSEAAESFKEIFSAAQRMAVILLYFYICDRTDIFMKANKHYTHGRFFAPIIYVALLGMLGIERTKQMTFLNRDQTDEWKGWMQLIILIYHITGASTNIPIYMHIRLLVAMYLFMTGYGHFSYFWNKGDFSLHRVYGVLFRLNFLTIMLCIVMDRPYQFYYFVPLCSFWYLVLYLAMAMWPRAHNAPNKNGSKADGAAEMKEVCQNGPSFRSPVVTMCFKLTLLLASILVLFFSQDVFEILFSWWPAIRIFELPPGSVREWWFRCHLDRFAMLHGAVFCFAYIILKRLSLMDDTRQGCLFSMKTSIVTVTISIAAILSYSLWTLHCSDKATCNSVHSFASILPISSFILVRNIPGYLRSGYSAFFAWFGRISLELFIGQYHVWLSADTKGVLVMTSPYWPTLNIVVTTIVFVCVAHEINRLTGIFVKHAVGSNRDSGRSLTVRFLTTCAILLVFMLINDLTNRPSSTNGSS